jgi:hypothetical protein
MDCLTRSRRGERGVSSIEMIIVLPVLLLLTFAICEFGLAFREWQLVQNAARVAARRASLFEDGCNGGAVRTAAETEARQLMQAAGLPSPRFSWVGASCVPGTVEVTVQHDFQLRFLRVFGPLVPPTLFLRGTAMMRNEA